LFEQTQHVPLVFSHPTLPPRELTSAVGLIDIAPSACALLNVPPMKGTDGCDLSPALRSGAEPAPRTFYAETLYPEELRATGSPHQHVQNLQALWLDSRTKIIRPFGDEAGAQVFDLVEDPHEVQPRALSDLPKSVVAAWPSLSDEAQ